MNHFLIVVNIGLLAVFATMSLAWFFQLRTRNAGIVDVTWAYNFAFLAFIYFTTTIGYFPRKFLFVLMVMVWSLRLGTYLFIRSVGKTEDSRYSEIRIKWGERADIKFYGLFLLQGLLNLILSIPFILIFTNTSTSLHWVEFLGFIIWLIAVIGEIMADAQLTKFKSHPANKGKVCDTGLWSYSRHPNYFFEWLVWVAFFVFALASPNGYLSIIAPLLMLWLLLRVTGIPAAEKQAIKSKGESYLRYQQSTSAFIPLPKRN